MAAAIALCTAVLSGCNKEDLSTTEGTSLQTKRGEIGDPGPTIYYSDSTKNGMTVLDSVRYATPYNIDTLKKAFNLLYPSGQATPTFKVNRVTATHSYIRFLPQDSTEFNALMDSGLAMTPIPIDRKVSVEGTHYFDPALEGTSDYTWQYTVVPIGTTLPDVDYEIIEQTRDRATMYTGAAPADINVWTAIETKAQQLCGITGAPTGPPGVLGPNSQLGRFEVWDSTAKKYVGARGGVVYIRSGTGYRCIDYQVLDSMGYYSNNSPCMRNNNPNDVLVQVAWRSSVGNYDWVVFDGEHDDDFSQIAYYDPPSLTANGSWNYRIKGGKQETFATTSRALYRMFYLEPYGLEKPCTDSGIFLGPTYLRAVCIDDYDHVNNYGGLYKPSKHSIIVWGRNDSEELKESSEVFGIVAHETAQLYHYHHKGTADWNDIDNRLVESWTRLLQFYITELEYYSLSRTYNIFPHITYMTKEALASPPSGPVGASSGIATDSDELFRGPGGNAYYFIPNIYNIQKWPFYREYGSPTQPGNTDPDNKNYSPLMIDLIDDSNQNLYFKLKKTQMGWPDDPYKYGLFPVDKVSGFDILEIEYGIINTETLSGFRDEIKSLRSSPQIKAQIDELFESYNYIFGEL